MVEVRSIFSTNICRGLNVRYGPFDRSIGQPQPQGKTIRTSSALYFLSLATTLAGCRLSLISDLFWDRAGFAVNRTFRSYPDTPRDLGSIFRWEASFWFGPTAPRRNGRTVKSFLRLRPVSFGSKPSSLTVSKSCFKMFPFPTPRLSSIT